MTRCTLIRTKLEQVVVLMSSPTVGIVGSGPAGLVTAHTLVQDGFDVQILTRDSTPGGVWAAERVYPGVALNTWVQNLYHLNRTQLHL